MQVPATEYRRAQIGHFTVDLILRELWNDGCKVNLQEKPFQILAILLQHPGELVTREELRTRLWPADTFVDFEHSINTAVKKLREALDDDAEQPRYVETLPKRGYRFIGPVEALVEEEKIVADLGKPWSPPTPVLLRPRTRRQMLLPVIILFLASVGIALTFSGLRDRLRPARTQPGVPAPIQSIAVLPLQNLSRDPDQEYFADGLTDSLITDLGKLPGLRVISHTSVSTYKKTNKRLPQIAQELGVDAIVEGTVLRSGSHLRVTVQLVRASPEEHLWAERYERDASEVIRMEQRLALAIAHEVTGRVITAEEARLRTERVTNPRAYDAYLRGRYLWSDRSAKQASEAGAHFEQALREDPNFALAYSGLADYYAVSWGSWVDLPRAEGYARQAVALDPELAEAHASLGVVTQYRAHWNESEKELKRAIELNPNYAMAHHWFSMHLFAMGRLNEALAENDRARRLDPFSFPVNFFRSAILMGMHQYDQAMQQLETAGAINPEAIGVHQSLARVYWIQGQGAEAIKEEVEEANLVKDPARLRILEEVTATFKTAGLHPAQLKLARLSEKTCAQGSEFPDPCNEFGIANQYGLLGRKDELLHWLQRGVRALVPTTEIPC